MCSYVIPCTELHGATGQEVTSATPATPMKTASRGLSRSQLQLLLPVTTRIERGPFWHIGVTNMGVPHNLEHFDTTLLLLGAKTAEMETISKLKVPKSSFVLSETQIKVRGTISDYFTFCFELEHIMIQNI